MWIAAGDIRDAMLTIDEIVSIHESSNLVHLIAGGRAPEPANGYLLEFRRNAAPCCIACIFFPGSGTLETYTPDAGPRAGTLDDGLSFLEGIGFIMSDLLFGSMPQGEKAKCLERLPFLSRDRAEFLRKTRERRKTAELASRDSFYGESDWKRSTGIADSAEKTMQDRLSLARLLASF
jgi:hypothetical protein